LQVREHPEEDDADQAAGNVDRISANAVRDAVERAPELLAGADERQRQQQEEEGGEGCYGIPYRT
jgi:hypothetical protein